MSLMKMVIYFKGGGVVFQVLKNDGVLFTGEYWDCFEFILKNQGMSVDYACKYSGYKIVEIKEVCNG